MKCRPAQKLISEYIDETLDAGRRTSLESHLQGCSGCRAFLADLRDIVGGAAGLGEIAPPDSVWLGVRAGLREKRVASAAYAARPRFRFALAGAAAALVLVAGGVAVFQPWKKGLPPVGAEKAALARQTLDKLNEAEWHYQQAIRALSEAMATEQGSIDPRTAATLAANLGIIDASIEACRQAVRTDPRDLRAQNALLSSYKDKVQVLTEWVSAKNRPAPEEKPGVSL